MRKSEGRVPPEFHQTTWCAEMTIDFIRGNKGRPWFFSFNCFDPHHPFDPPPEYLAKYNPADMPLPDSRHDSLGEAPVHLQQFREIHPSKQPAW